MEKIWQMWSGGLDDTTIDNIITECSEYPLHNATIGENGYTTNDKYRSSEVRWIDSANSLSSSILWNYAKEANRNAFGFDVDYLNDIQFTTYNASDGGKYDWHHDTFWGNTSQYDRKVTVVIQLTEPSEYEGGELQFDTQYEQPNKVDLMKKGTVIAFPSFIPHRVTQLTSGVRKSLVGWIEGPKFR
jgi:PKHD-type hydroxylase